MREAASAEGATMVEGYVSNPSYSNATQHLEMSDERSGVDSESHLAVPVK
jgi:hypothetical protein